MPVTKRSRSSSQLIFYLMFVYILASFSWWAIMFLRNNQQSFQDDAALLKKEWVAQNGSEAGLTESAVYLELAQELRKKNTMIIGEGFFFIVLISIGFWRIRNSFKEEVALTKQQNNFILSITHELKSPLASIKLSLETLLKRNLGREQVERISTRSLDDVERLERMVENILMASRLESPAHRFENSEFDFSSMVSRIHRVTCEKQPELSIEANLEEGHFVNGDSFAISSVVVNLLENAIKYSKGEGTISVRLHQQQQQTVLEVADEGIGIPAKEKELIFKRFYRIGSEETRASKGTGLGLFIVQEIVKAHGGQIQVRDNQPKGSIFQVNLPLMTPASAGQKEAVSEMELPQPKLK